MRRQERLERVLARVASGQVGLSPRQVDAAMTAEWPITLKERAHLAQVPVYLLRLWGRDGTFRAMEAEALARRRPTTQIWWGC